MLWEETMDEIQVVTISDVVEQAVDQDRWVTPLDANLKKGSVLGNWWHGGGPGLGGS